MSAKSLMHLMLDMELFTYEEVELVLNINGWTEKSLLQMLYARYSTNDITKIIEKREDEYLHER